MKRRLIKPIVLSSIALALLTLPALGGGPDYQGMQIQSYDPPKPAPDRTERDSSHPDVVPPARGIALGRRV